jgi:ABC-2 type transport system permease protein
MQALRKLSVVQFKLFIREPVAAFFALAFAPLVLVLFGFIYGNEPIAQFGGRGSIDIAVPGYTGMIIGTVGLMSVPIATSARREAGVLRRFRATPLRPLTYMVTDVLVYLLMTLLGIVLLFIVAKLGYNVRFDGSIVSVLLAIALGAFAFMAMGYVLAGLAPTARVAQVVAMVLFYPMMFLSGASIPLEVMPEGVRNAARFLPLTHVVTLVKGLWFGETWPEHVTEVIVLGAILIAGAAVASRVFRWE